MNLETWNTGHRTDEGITDEISTPSQQRKKRINILMAVIFLIFVVLSLLAVPAMYITVSITKQYPLYGRLLSYSAILFFEYINSHLYHVNESWISLCYLFNLKFVCMKTCFNITLM